ncbi:c-type cytochrome [Roseivivax sediminis]|uniref:Cytochrome c n=1 Tax=Roseivivax sediminis TaxID=936889 RepID=A0A1I1UFW0_9RHOB|nr:cytochrome C [Roseivivax sediminis]SFD69742.1 cytochrome c [Roseivivax sediminis]
MIRKLSVLLACLLAGPAPAQDAAAGARAFAACTACHAVIAPDGTVLRGGGRAGPNLYGAAGALAGRQAGFNYSPWLRRLGDAGVHWTPDTFAAYLRNPTEFTKAQLGESSARSRMAFRMDRSAADIHAYLASLER